MARGRVEQYVDSVQAHLTPDDNDFEAVRPVVTALVLPYALEPWRFHHTVAHLEEKAQFLTENIDSLRSPRVVFGASVGHDNLYQPWLYNAALGTSAVNEKQSSRITKLLLSPYFPSEEVDKMAAYIEATAEHPSDVNDSDLAHFLDSDMLVLGAEEERFERYEDDIFKEFTWLGTVDRRAYLMGRLAFFASIQPRRVFCTEVAQDLHEAKAHKNIGAMALRHQRELSRLS